MTEFERWWANYFKYGMGLSFKQVAQAAWNAAKMRAGT